MLRVLVCVQSAARKQRGFPEYLGFMIAERLTPYGRTPCDQGLPSNILDTQAMPIVEGFVVAQGYAPLSTGPPMSVTVLLQVCTWGQSTCIMVPPRMYLALVSDLGSRKMEAIPRQVNIDHEDEILHLSATKEARSCKPARDQHCGDESF